MTEQNPAIFLQAGSHPAEDVRRALASLVDSGGTSGIIGSSSLAVTQNGTPNMSVNVASGRAWIAGDEATYQGSYFVENRGTVNLAISASDPSNPRIDLVVAKVQDSDYSGATDAWSLAVVTGTPAGSPSAPSAPDNSITLAQVAVAASASTVVTANITDTRTQIGNPYRVGGTDVPVTDGGTGASSAGTARTNLGLGTIATQAASAVAITGGTATGITNLVATGGTITGITDLALADGGTGASTAAAARTNLEIFAGVTTVSFTSGTGTLTYGVTLPAGTKVVNTTIQAVNTTEYVVRVNGTPGTTTCAVLCHAAGSLHTGSLSVHWSAIVAT